MEQALGFNLDGYSYAEAQQMFVEHERAAWQHTSFAVAYMLEVNRDRKKGKPIPANKLNPWESTGDNSTGIKLTAENRHLLKAFATNGKSSNIQKD